MASKTCCGPGGGVIALPEGGDDGLGTALQEGVADSRDFDAVYLAAIAQSRLTGRQHDQMHPRQRIKIGWMMQRPG